MGDGAPELQADGGLGETGENSLPDPVGLPHGMVWQGEPLLPDCSELPDPLGEKSLLTSGVAGGEGDAARAAGSRGDGREGRALRPVGDTGRRGVFPAEGAADGCSEAAAPPV